jgi:serine phosphatase RsbU (regulator of sigma subunit)
LQTRGHATFETEHLTKDGRRVPVEISARLFDLKGDSTILAVARDITERKLAEKYRDISREVLQILNEQGEFRDSIQGVIGTLKARTGFDAVGIRLQKGDGFPCFAQEGLAEEFLPAENVPRARETGDDVCRDESGGLILDCPCGLVLSGAIGQAAEVLTPGGSFWTNDSFQLLGPGAEGDPQSRPRNLCIREGYSSIAVVPIRDSHGIVGLIQFNDRRPGRFSLATIELLEVIAAHIGAALVRKSAESALHESELLVLEASRRAERLHGALNELNARLNASFDHDSTLDELLEMACSALECDTALLGRSALGQMRVEHAFGYALPDDGLVLDTLSLGTTALHAPLLLTGSGSPANAWLSARLGLAEAIVAPIPAREGRSGVLLLGRAGGGQGFDDQTVRFAARFALSLAYAAQAEAEHHIAETLQEALLVMPAEIDGLDFAHLYRSSTAATRVGGDFYDVFSMNEGRVGILVGDVSGKGLEAAVFTSVIKHAIRAFCHDSVSPADAVARANTALFDAANTALFDAADTVRFASVFFAIVDGANDSIAYCNAGHMPAVVIGRDGSVRQFGVTSPIIGAFPDVVYADRTDRLGPDETVLLYTDGVTEARDPKGIFFEEEGLLPILASTSMDDLAHLPKAILDAVLTFTGGRLTDDIALLAFRRSGALPAGH